MKTQDAFDILEAVEAKTYTRNDLNNAPKFGFIAQEMESAVMDKPHYQCLVGSTEPDGEEPSLKTLQYDRLTSILWTCVKVLYSKVQALENAAV